MKRIAIFFGFVLAPALSSCGDTQKSDAFADLPLQDVQSGYDFLQPETQALQNDDFANPGFLWVDRGKALFTARNGAAKSCAECHEAKGLALKGAATRYPALDGRSRSLVNLEGRINLCRERHQQSTPLAYESDALLALSAYVSHLSRGMALSVEVPDALQENYAAGRDYFFTRRGQLNLSCHQCHDESWGKKLRGDTISQGHGNGFPAYRLEWQSLGSLQRRIQDCDMGVRAEPFALGSPTYLNLELYLAARSSGLAIETPAVRR